MLEPAADEPGDVARDDDLEPIGAAERACRDTREVALYEAVRLGMRMLESRENTSLRSGPVSTNNA